MQKKYEAPELTLIGQVSEAVLGTVCCGNDGPLQTAPDFEFEQD
jgi:hypothetical protein